MTDSNNALLVIGGRSLVGRRLRDIASSWPGEVRFTSRKPLNDQSLMLDMKAPKAFRPGLNFPTVIACTPIWLIEEPLLEHLAGLGMLRLIAFSSTSLFTKQESETEEEREVVSKLEHGEKSIIDFCERRGVAWTILRPTLIYDEGFDENVTRMASLIRKLGFFPVCGPAGGLRQPVHARDLARAALAAAVSNDAKNKAYNVPGGESLTYRAMAERIFMALDRKPMIVDIPESLWRLAFAGLNLLQPGRAVKRNIGMVLRMNQDLWFDALPAVRDFGYAPGPFQPDFTCSSPPVSSGS